MLIIRQLPFYVFIFLLVYIKFKKLLCKLRIFVGFVSFSHPLSGFCYWEGAHE